MNKIHLQKNCLDLEYQKNLQILNATLSLGIWSVITFLGGLILNFEKWFIYSAILAIICSTVYYIYRKTNVNLNNLSNQIKDLKT